MRWILLAFPLLSGALQESRPATRPKAGTWWIQVADKDSGMLIREDGKEKKKLDILRYRQGARLSPDGKRWAHVGWRESQQDILVTSQGGEKRSFVTSDPAPEAMPDWSPDGKEGVFARRVYKHWQIHLVDLASKEVTQLTEFDGDAMRPRFSPLGDRIAYIARPKTRKFTKLPKGHLVVIDTKGRRARRLIEDARILEAAWSPDGKQIACSTVDSLLILGAQRGKPIRSIKPEEIDQRLYAHGADHLCWRPDGKAIATRIRFLGGRMEGAVVFGDEQLFVVSTSGAVRYIELGERRWFVPLRWKRDW